MKLALGTLIFPLFFRYRQRKRQWYWIFCSISTFGGRRFLRFASRWRNSFKVSSDDVICISKYCRKLNIIFILFDDIWKKKKGIRIGGSPKMTSRISGQFLVDLGIIMIFSIKEYVVTKYFIPSPPPLRLWSHIWTTRGLCNNNELGQSKWKYTQGKGKKLAEWQHLCTSN